MRKGWFILEGQDGDRTLEEQMIGLEQALLDAKGGTVLDLGCAEALIAREFIRAGAKSVHGIDSVQDHITVAREVCLDLPVTFHTGDLSNIADYEAYHKPRQYDMVLALAIAHKLRNPKKFIQFVARSARRFAVIRLPWHAKGSVVKDKHLRNYETVDIKYEMHAKGMTLTKVVDGPRGEKVHYYKR